MSFIGRILRKDQKVVKAKMIEATSSCSAYNGDAYSSDVFREAVDSVARNAGKLKGSHIVRYPDHKQEIGDGGRTPGTEDITRAVILMRRTSVLMYAAGMAVLFLPAV